MTHLEWAAADWKGLMPPYVQTANAVPSFEEEMSDTMKLCEFTIFILPWYCLLSNCIGRIFQPSSNVVPEGTTESQTTSGLFSLPRTVSTQHSELPQEEPHGAITKLFNEPQTVPQVSMQLYRPHAEEIYPHLDQHYDPPPSQLPQKKRKGFRQFKMKLREFFGFRR